MHFFNISSLVHFSALEKNQQQHLSAFMWFVRLFLCKVNREKFLPQTVEQGSVKIKTLEVKIKPKEIWRRTDGVKQRQQAWGRKRRRRGRKLQVTHLNVLPGAHSSTENTSPLALVNVTPGLPPLCWHSTGVSLRISLGHSC